MEPLRPSDLRLTADLRGRTPERPILIVPQVTAHQNRFPLPPTASLP
jgi:hypothetical protein